MKSLTPEEYATLFYLAVETDHATRNKKLDKGNVCHVCIVKEKLRHLAGNALSIELRYKPEMRCFMRVE